MLVTYDLRGNTSRAIDGTLDLLILKTLTLGPLHGYAIAQRLQQVSRDVVIVQQGTLYPALHRLEERGALKAEWKPSDTGRDAVRERVLALLGGFFGALALLLAGVGLYGVTSYAVTLRRGEIGVRMALGADVSRVVRLVLGRAAWLVVFGVAIGTGLSLWLARFVSALLFGLEARNAATLVAAVAMMAVVATLAALLPAWRATRIDPVEVLREG